LIGALAASMATSASAAVMLLVAASSGEAQEVSVSAGAPDTRGAKLREIVEHTVIGFRNTFENPLHPIVSAVAPGGGIGAGVGYDTPGGGSWEAGARAIYTVNKYWLAEGTLGFKTRRGRFDAFGRARDMRRLDYYGLGPGSTLSSRTSYSYRDPAIGAQGSFRLAPWLSLGGRAEHIWPYARAGDRLPSVEQRFFPNDAPGLFAQPRFGRYQGSAKVEIPGGVGDAFYQGTKLRTSYTIYDDRTLDIFNFTRLDLEAQQTFAGFAAHHRVTLSGWVSTSMTDGGQQVPFYLLHTLGGKSQIRGMHENRLGTDGTEATLRGFRNLRFRDRDLLLMQAEYRLPVWGPVEATVFADAGKVAGQRSDLDLTDLRRDFGFSASMMQKWSTVARVDVGFGSGERARVFFTFGGLAP
jgi:hypothetical protein